MAKLISSQSPQSSVSPWFELEVTEDTSLSTSTKSCLRYSFYYKTKGSGYEVYSVARPYTISINGSVVKSGSVTVNGVTSTSTSIVSNATTYIDKGSSSKNIALSFHVDWQITYSGVYKASHDASGSISIPAIKTYAISYDANGGTGAPSNQTKTDGVNITLSSTKPTRTGYSFLNWNTRSDGSGSNYSPGGTYSSNSPLALYAQWDPIKYSVVYDANGGTGVIEQQTKIYGTTLQLTTTKPSRTYYDFVNWCTDPNGLGDVYESGGVYTGNANLKLYAIWALAYVPPKISNITAVRCLDSSGSVEDPYQGTYARVEFDWECDQNLGPNPAVITVADEPISMGRIIVSETVVLEPWLDKNFTTAFRLEAGKSYDVSIGGRLYNGLTARDYSRGDILLGDDNLENPPFFIYQSLAVGTPISICTNDELRGAYTVTIREAGGESYSGHVQYTIARTRYSPELSYSISIVVQDNYAATTSSISLTTSEYCIDFKAGGKGVCVGGVATKDRTFECAWPAEFEDDVDVGGGLNVGGDADLTGDVDIAGIASFNQDACFNKNITFENGEQTENRGIVFGNTNGAYPHNLSIFGGSPSSKRAFGVWDNKNSRGILEYDDTLNLLTISPTTRLPAANLRVDGDSNGSKTKARMDELLAMMPNLSIMPVAFQCYPFIDGSTYYGWLSKHDANYCILFVVGYSGSRISWIKSAGTWQAHRKVSL